MKEWLNAFEQITPAAYRTLIVNPPPKILDRSRTPTLLVQKVSIFDANPKRIFITLSGDKKEIEISLAELMHNHLEQAGELTSLMSRREIFALQLIWFDLGMNENDEEVRAKTFKLFTQSVLDITEKIGITVNGLIPSKTLH